MLSKTVILEFSTFFNEWSTFFDRSTVSSTDDTPPGDHCETTVAAVNQSYFAALPGSYNVMLSPDVRIKR